MASKIAYILFLSFFWSPANAHDTEKSRAVYYPDRFEEVIGKCFTHKNWADETIKFSSPGKFRSYWYDSFAAPLKLYPSFIQAYETTSLMTLKTLVPEERSQNALDRMELFARYILWHEKKLEEEEMKAFRKACMILCVTSNYFDYNYRPDTKLGTMAKKINEGEGDCTVYSEFADRLAELVGVESRIVLNIKEWHAYIKFKVKNKWYYAEPLNAECKFMDPKAADTK